MGSRIPKAYRARETAAGSAAVATVAPIAGPVRKTFSAQDEPIPPGQQHVRGRNLEVFVKGTSSGARDARSPINSKYSRRRIAPAPTVIGWSVKAKRIFG